MSGAGTLITDGTVVWIVDDVRDGSRVGDIIIRPTLRDGFVKANGAVLKASEYPRLLRYAVDNSLTVTAAVYATDCSKYVYDSTADTLQVPNMIGRVLQGGDTGASIAAGLPNMTGSISADQGIFAGIGGGDPNHEYGSGAVSFKTSLAAFSGGSNGFFRYGIYALDASKSNAIYGASTTVQPPALQMIPQIKY